MKKYHNIDEAELLETIDKVANRLASKYRFGYHDIDDMKQQARLEALKGLDKYDGKRPLENFLWTHVRNRLHNFKRDNYFRPEKPCDKCPLLDKVNNVCTKYSSRMECDLYAKWHDRTERRKSLMSTAEDLDMSHEYDDAADLIDKKTIFDMVDQNIPVELRENWIRFINNLKLNKNKREQIKLEIQLIIQEQMNVNTQEG